MAVQLFDISSLGSGPRTIAAAVVAGIAFWSPAPAAAQEFPSETVTLLVPWSAGGGADTSARLMAEPLSRELGVDVVVRNVEGAGSMTGMAELWRAEPDGHTVGLTYVQHTVANQVFEEAVPYEVQEFEFVGQFIVVTYMMAVAADSEFRSIEDVMNADRAIRFCVPSARGTEALTALAFGEAADVEVSLVSGYPGSAPTVLGLMRGECDVVTSASTLKGAIDAGDIEPVLVLGNEPSPWFPDIPTLADVGLPTVLADLTQLNFVMWAPPEVPEERLDVLESALFSAMDELEQELFEQWLVVEKRPRDEVRKTVTSVLETTKDVSPLVQ